VVRTGRALRVRDEVGVRALNDALRSAFDAPGSAGFTPGGNRNSKPATTGTESRRARTSVERLDTASENDLNAILAAAMRAQQSVRSPTGRRTHWRESQRGGITTAWNDYKSCRRTRFMRASVAGSL
jgi:hypothetical protein